MAYGVDEDVAPLLPEWHEILYILEDKHTPSCEFLIFGDSNWFKSVEATGHGDLSCCNFLVWTARATIRRDPIK